MTEQCCKHTRWSGSVIERQDTRGRTIDLDERVRIRLWAPSLVAHLVLGTRDPRSEGLLGPTGATDGERFARRTPLNAGSSTSNYSDPPSLE